MFDPPSPIVVLRGFTRDLPPFPQKTRGIFEKNWVPTGRLFVTKEHWLSLLFAIFYE